MIILICTRLHWTCALDLRLGLAPWNCALDLRLGLGSLCLSMLKLCSQWISFNLCRVRLSEQNRMMTPVCVYLFNLSKKSAEKSPRYESLWHFFIKCYIHAVCLLIIYVYEYNEWMQVRMYVHVCVYYICLRVCSRDRSLLCMCMCK